MNTGAQVLSALARHDFYTKDVVITRTGKWLVGGVERTPEQALLATDVVFIAMHGEFGENGEVQKICERLHVPFTGSNSFQSRVAFNKDTTKRLLRAHNILLPRHVKFRRDSVVTIDDRVYAIARAFGPDYVIKPTMSGSSFGVKLAKGSAALVEEIRAVLAEYEECMVEERIFGREATCGVIEHFREQPLYALPPIEIVPPSHREFFAADVKYTGETAEICPGRFSFSEKQAIIDGACLAHSVLGLSQYSRSDFMVSDGKVYFLEVNTLPGLTNESLFPKAADAVGLPFHDLVAHLVRTASVYPRMSSPYAPV
jgi:D-alanine-D-alanine ligase